MADKSILREKEAMRQKKETNIEVTARGTRARVCFQCLLLSWM